MWILRRVLSLTPAVALLAIIAQLVAGCGGTGGRPAEKTYPVTGTVALDGKPMADGEIIFKDTATGAVHIIPIKDGKFQGQASAGAKRVEIYAYKMEIDPVAKEMYGAEAQPTKVNIIPAKYNTESTLKATVEAATDPGKNNFSFEITSK
ncbi:MAG: hypothetical protein RMJ16_15160 [Thermoguttaceae bacterium]|nr:hypothetical protein [Thermoguttaceae bacterium]